MINFLTHGAWNWVTLAAVVVGLLASVWFAVQLQVQTKGAWRDNPFGRFLMYRKVILAALFTVVLLNRVGWDWWEVIRQPITALLMIAFALQTFVPYRLLMEAQQDRAVKEDEGHDLR